MITYVMHREKERERCGQKVEEKTLVSDVGGGQKVTKVEIGD